MKKKFLLFSILLATATSLFADWTFKNGTFTMNGDTSFYITSSNSLFIQSFGYYLNNSSTFHSISLSDLDEALTFKDGDKVKFAKKGLFYNYYATETSSNVYTISSKGTGLTIPFSFSLKAVNNISTPSVEQSAPATAAGAPLPSVAITSIFALMGSGFILSKRRKNK